MLQVHGKPGGGSYGLNVDRPRPSGFWNQVNILYDNSPVEDFENESK